MTFRGVAVKAKKLMLGCGPRAFWYSAIISSISSLECCFAS